MNVFDLLKQDHQKVSNIFEQLESSDGIASSQRQALFTQLKQELDIHAHVEETILYPVLKQVSETREITVEAYEEHQEVKDLLAELEAMPIDDEEWNDTLLELKSNVEHHVDEEENEMFERARTVLSPGQIDDIGNRIEEAKRQQKAASA